MLLLLAAAAIPLVSLSGTLAWRDYLSAKRDVIESANLTREAATAGQRASLQVTRHLLTALAAQIAEQGAGFSTADCVTALQTAMRLDPDAYHTLLVFDQTGNLMCSPKAFVRSNIVDVFSRVAVELRPGTPELVRAIAPDNDHGAMLGIAVPIDGQAGVSGSVVACMRLERLVAAMQMGLHEGTQVWLVDEHDTSALVGAALLGDTALPADPAVLRTSRGHGVIAPARDGVQSAYASQMLPGDVVLLAGYRAGADLDVAWRVLMERLAMLAVLLGGAFVLTGAGIHQSMVRPLTALAGAVQRWRGGADFAAEMPAGIPTEVAELSLAFRDATIRLAEREAQVRAALEERNLLMQEIHHRVKNNLQIIASLLNLQAGRIRQPEARAEFLSARNRVRALATLHRHLYAYGDLHRINMRGFLTELCGQLFEAMGETEGDRITLSIEASELEMASDQAVPVALIVTETVSNALKYAFPRPRSGRVSVTLTISDEHTATLCVEDDGIGLPAGRSETETGTRDGLGIQLVRGFAKQIGAALTVTEIYGTQYQLVIPLHVSAPAAVG